jgi:antirestriction protein ArdC
MITTIPNGVKFQKGAGLSGYVADIGASFLCADLGIVPEMEPRPDHASYVESWLRVLQGDRKAIFQAAAHAQRAVAYLHELQPQAEIQREAA